MIWPSSFPAKGDALRHLGIRRPIWAFILFLATLSVLRADIHLPGVLASGMVLQQQTEIVLWGWAKPGEYVRVTASWSRQSVATHAGDGGEWQVRIRTPRAGGPYSIRFQGTNDFRLDDVLIGEVWLCSGQSNMEVTLKFLGGWAAFPKERKSLRPTTPNEIRLCTLAKAKSEHPVDRVEAGWSRATPEAIESFSATAFFFGREIQRRLGVPVGLICSAWGGTEAEAWTPHAALERDPALASCLEDPGGDDPNRPSVLFNAMIHPLLRNRIRGVIWYQGESNLRNADLYHHLFPALIHSWRKAFGQRELPFHFVQIAPFIYPDPEPTSAFVREAQRLALQLPATGMVVTTDIGDPSSIHPKNKPEVGRRLALWALAKTYRRPVGEWSGPLLRETVVEQGRLRLRFDHTTGGLKAPGGRLEGFTVAGEDGRFIPAEALIVGQELLVSSRVMAEPRFARYGFEHAPKATLFNGSGLPASPFRTDRLPLLLRGVRASAAWDPTSGKARVTLACADPACVIRYTLDGKAPSAGNPAYTSPVHLNGSFHLRARAFAGPTPSDRIQDLVFERHRGLGAVVKLVQPPSPLYPGWPGALSDGVEGSTDLHDGRWMGFEGADFEAVVDLGEIRQVSGLALTLLHDRPNRVFPPTAVEAACSADGKSFDPAVFLTVPKEIGSKDPAVVDYHADFAPRLVRYLRVKAVNAGTCPPGHEGAGKKAWLFLSEVKVRAQSP